MNPNINWHYPPPRPGWRRELDAFIGTGATRAELILEVAAALAGGLLMLVCTLTQPLAWTGWQVALTVLLAFDLAGAA